MGPGSLSSVALPWNERLDTFASAEAVAGSASKPTTSANGGRNRRLTMTPSHLYALRGIRAAFTNWQRRDTLHRCGSMTGRGLERPQIADRDLRFRVAVAEAAHGL